MLLFLAPAACLIEDKHTFSAATLLNALREVDTGSSDPRGITGIPIWSYYLSIYLSVNGCIHHKPSGVNR